MELSSDRESLDPAAALTEYRLRTVRIGVWATVFVLVPLFAYVLIPGDDEIRAGPALGVLMVAALGAGLIALLPWRRLFTLGLGLRFMYAWSVLDILLVTLLIAFSGDSHMEIFFLYAFTTLFFAASYPLRGQVALLAFTLACYLGVMVVQGWPIEPPDLAARISLLAVLAYMASFLSRELVEQMSASGRARAEASRRAELLASVTRATRSLSTLSSDRVLQAVVASTRELGFDAAMLAVYTQDRSAFRVAQPSGVPADYVPGLHPSSGAMAGLVRDRQETVTVHDVAEEDLPDLRSAGFRAAMGTPVWVQGHLDAALVAATRTARQLESQDVEAMELLAAAAGRALENARRFEEERRTVARFVELDRMKSDFVSNVSHELRTPLTAIEGVGLTLERRWEQLDDEARRDLLEGLNANARSLHEIITTLLDFATIQAGALEVRWRQVELRPWLESTMHRLRPVLHEHPIELDIPMPVVASGDPVLLDRVLENLLSNAAKHTPPGTRVRLSAQRENGAIRVAVADEGPGISPEDLPFVTERFFRGGDPLTRGTRGTGLGLAFVREILRLHRSDLEVASELGHGSEFAFRLPLAAKERT